MFQSLFIHSTTVAVYYMLSTVLDTGDAAVIKTHRLAVLMEVTARRVDRQSVSPSCTYT